MGANLVVIKATILECFTIGITVAVDSWYVEATSAFATEFLIVTETNIFEYNLWNEVIKIFKEMLVASNIQLKQENTLKNTHLLLYLHCKKYEVKKGDRSVKRVKSYSKWSKLLNNWVTLSKFHSILSKFSLHFE